MSLPLVAARLFATQVLPASVADKATDWMDRLKTVLIAYAIPLGAKIIGAILLWVIGRIVIKGIRVALTKVYERKKLDATLVRYLNSVVGVVLTLALILSILGLFGIETTSFAGVLAAAGVAIGMAWSGLLSNFAAGVFLMALRPFEVGDMISAAGVTGIVKEIGLFATTIDTADNVRTFVSNSKLFGDNIQNYTANPYRRVDLKAQVAHSSNSMEAIERLRARIRKIPNVVKEPAPVVELLEVTATGPVLAVRPFCHNDHYWEVYFAANKAILEEMASGDAVSAEHRVAG